MSRKDAEYSSFTTDFHPLSCPDTARGSCIKMLRMKLMYLFFMSVCFSFSVHAQSSSSSGAASIQFWKNLQSLCGKAFAGTVTQAPANDTNFANKTLLMHVIQCSSHEIRIPFHVGNNRSRTWVLTLKDSLIELRHDHRHEDGHPDKVTQYGGLATSTGMPTVQYFPADQFTVNLLPNAAANVWWMELQMNQYFSYNLRRIGSDRQYSIRFDLSKPVAPPPAPWGFEVKH